MRVCCHSVAAWEGKPCQENDSNQPFPDFFTGEKTWGELHVVNHPRKDSPPRIPKEKCMKLQVKGEGLSSPSSLGKESPWRS